MTSMLLIESAIARAGSACATIEATVSTTPLHLLRAIAWRELLLRRVLRSTLLDHLADHRAVAGHERRNLLEARAVPPLELHHPRAFVVETAGLDRRKESRRTQLLDAGLGEVQVLEPPAQLIGPHDLALAELRLGRADRLDDDHAVDDAAGVHDVAEARGVFEIAFAAAVNLGLDLLHHREIGARRGECGADIAFRSLARGNDIFLRPGLPDAKQLV